VLTLQEDGSVDPEELAAAVEDVAGDRRRAAAITVISTTASTAGAAAAPTAGTKPVAGSGQDADTASGPAEKPVPPKPASRSASTDAPVK